MLSSSYVSSLPSREKASFVARRILPADTSSSSRAHFYLLPLSLSSCARIVILNAVTLSFLVPSPSGHYSYSHFSVPSPLLRLSYCEQQQTTPYSSSGFAIVHSTPQFRFGDILQSTNSVSLPDEDHHDQNTVFTIVDPSTSGKSAAVMSSTKESHTVQHETNASTSITILSTRTSYPSLFPTALRFDLTLFVGCICASMAVVALIIYALIKYRKRDAGSYKIDESSNFVATSYLDNHDNLSKLSSSSFHRQKLLTINDQSLADSREWYV